jgi:hypothetical protein
MIGFPLTKTILRFHFDVFKEFIDVQSRDGGKEYIIEKINNVESSILDWTSYNLERNTFFLW